ncbi:hypothetical protein [Caballeronia sp. M23-90]
MTTSVLSDCGARRLAESASETSSKNLRSPVLGMDEMVKGVSALFEQVLRRLGVGDYAIRCGLRFVHAPHTQCAITDLDVVVVTPFGAFVVCVMPFQGSVEPGLDAETLIAAHAEDGAVLHTAPVRRLAAVLRALRSLLSVYGCPVEGLAIAAATPCQIHPLLPESILAPDELYHYLRLRLLRFFEIRKPHVVVSQAIDVIDRRSKKPKCEPR